MQNQKQKNKNPSCFKIYLKRQSVGCCLFIISVSVVLYVKPESNTVTLFSDAECVTVTISQGYLHSFHHLQMTNVSKFLSSRHTLEKIHVSYTQPELYGLFSCFRPCHYINLPPAVDRGSLQLCFNCC